MNRPRILVVDDESGMLHAVRRILEGGAELALHSSPEAALAAVEGFAPDLAIVDLRLPRTDGFTLLRALKQRRPQLDVILMTGSLSDLDGKLTRSVREQVFFLLQKPFDRELLRTVVDRWRELRRLEQENRRYVARLEAELQQARRFQQSMLPGDRGSIAGVELRGEYVPCDDLGGDLYDWADVGDGRVALLIADVSGHGVSAAMLTGFVKAAFHSAHVDDYRPRSVVRRVANGLRSMDDGCFVTLVSARLAPGAGRLELVSAGHHYGFLWDGAGGRREIAPTGPLVSPGWSDADWTEAEHAWVPGSRLLLFTDGIEEAADEKGELYGRERLLALLDRAADASDLLPRLMADVRGFVGQRPLRDDATLLAAGG